MAAEEDTDSSALPVETNADEQVSQAHSNPLLKMRVGKKSCLGVSCPELDCVASIDI